MPDKLTPPAGYVVRYDTRTGKPYLLTEKEFAAQTAAADPSVPAAPENAPAAPAAPEFHGYESYTYAPAQGPVCFEAPAAAPVPPQCAAAPASAVPDSACAGFFPRFAARLADCLLAGALSLAAGLAFRTALTALGADPAAYILFHFTAVQVFRWVVFTAYFVLFTRLLSGATPGKLLLRLRVVAADGRPLGWWTVLYRETVGRYLTSLLCIGYLVLAFDRQHRGFHDMLCDTRVVYAEAAPAPAPGEAV